MVSTEYFGGVLASSRTEVGRDDRGAAFVALIGRLSSYQIRSHYFFYTFVPMQSYASAMEFGEDENFDVLLSHVLFGLSRGTYRTPIRVWRARPYSLSISQGREPRNHFHAVSLGSGAIPVGARTRQLVDAQHPKPPHRPDV
jgi:hypothetical protein